MSLSAVFMVSGLVIGEVIGDRCGDGSGVVGCVWIDYDGEVVGRGSTGEGAGQLRTGEVFGGGGVGIDRHELIGIGGGANGDAVAG